MDQRYAEKWKQVETTWNVNQTKKDTKRRPDRPEVRKKMGRVGKQKEWRQLKGIKEGTPQR